MDINQEFNERLLHGHDRPSRRNPGDGNSERSEVESPARPGYCNGCGKGCKLTHPGCGHGARLARKQGIVPKF